MSQHVLPNQNNPWSISKIIFLFRRLGFSIKFTDVKNYLNSSPEDLVDQLFDDALNMPLSPDPGWANFNNADFTASGKNRGAFFRDHQKIVFEDFLNNGLRDRLKEYSKLGAKFTKWRGVYNISKDFPSKLSIQSNAHALARYSALVQECNMVPIVEPEVLMDGDHSAKECFQKTSEVIKKCFEELILHKVDLKGVILKPNMILAGNKSKEKTSNEEVAKLTLDCLKSSVPSEVPGIAFYLVDNQNWKRQKI